MNYKRIHDNIIKRAKNRTLDGYGEWHHINPRCMGGSDNRANKVHLTPEEHFVIHQLLVKMYPDEKKLVYAAHMMTRNKIGRNNKLYGWLRRKFSKTVSQIHRGKIVSEETRIKMSIAKSGTNNPMFGKHHSLSVLAAMSKRRHSQETREKMSQSQKRRHIMKH